MGEVTEPRWRQQELAAHLYASLASRDQEEQRRLAIALEQAEALLILRGAYATWSGKFEEFCPLQMLVGLSSMELVASSWREALACRPETERFVACVDSLLSSRIPNERLAEGTAVGASPPLIESSQVHSGGMNEADSTSLV